MMVLLHMALGATAFTLFGTLSFMWMEGWSFLDAADYTTDTLSTVGYGDINVKSDSAKLFVILYAFLGVGLIANIISKMQGVIESMEVATKHHMEQLRYCEAPTDPSRGRRRCNANWRHGRRSAPRTS